MKTKFKVSFVVIVAIIVVPLTATAWSGKCVGVSDGDTISVMHEGKAEEIKLYGIDCPEMEQPFGMRAKQFTSDMVFGKVVVIKAVTRDSDGKTVAWVFADGKILNAELVRVGLAWQYKQYSREEDLALFEANAWGKKIGLWSDSNSIPPRDWRRGVRETKREKFWQKGWFSALSIPISILAIIISFLYPLIRRKKELRSLITIFATELVLAFHRCVIYYMQKKQDVVSFSELFFNTDASTMANFAAAGVNPQILADIIYLRARYFQISRLVKKAAQLAVDASQHSKGTIKYRQLKGKATKVRNNALSFFLAEYRPELYKDIEDGTNRIVQAVKKLSRKNIATYLTSIFDTAKNVKRELDSMKTKNIKGKKLKEKLKELEERLNSCLVQ